MKKTIHLILVLFILSNITNAQTEKLLEKVKKQSVKIKSGSYIVKKRFKYFDFNETKTAKLAVQFCELKNTTLCIINDLENEEIMYFDTSKYVYHFSKKDSIFRFFVAYNPNQDLLYRYIQPYGYPNIYPSDLKTTQIINNKTSCTFIDTNFNNESDLFRNEKFEFTIDKKLNAIISYKSYLEMKAKNGGYNNQIIEESITDVKINNLKAKRFLKKINQEIKKLPIKRKILMGY